MFHNQTKIEKLTPEVLANISSHLTVASILQLALASKSFKTLMTDESIFRKLTERDFGVTEIKVTEDEKRPTWVALYRDLLLSQQEEDDKKNDSDDSRDSAAAAEAENDVEMTEVVEAEMKQVKEENENGDDTEGDFATPDNNNNNTNDSNAGGNTTAGTGSEEQQDSKEEKDASSAAQNDKDTEENVPIKTESDKNNDECPHLDELSDTMKEIKRILFKSPYRYSCDICHKKSVEFLNMSVITHSEACTDCLSQTDVEDDNHYPIQLHLESCELYCFKCGEGKPRKLTVEKDGNDVRAILDYIKAPESADDLDKRRKAEQQLYIQELRREDMTLMHYLVEKQWGRTWMLFRNREGSPLPTKITNNKLARMNGTLDPNIRLPMDKYRPSPETHGDIISEKLWGYLSKAYGVLGRAYNEDDIIAPEYARLRVYVDDFKKSIDLYP